MSSALIKLDWKGKIIQWLVSVQVQVIEIEEYAFELSAVFACMFVPEELLNYNIHLMLEKMSLL